MNNQVFTVLNTLTQYVINKFSNKVHFLVCKYRQILAGFEYLRVLELATQGVT